MSIETMTAAELTVDDDVCDLIAAVLAEHDCEVLAPGMSSPGGADDQLWHQLEELGLARLATPEDRGGSNAGWAAAAELVTALARRGCCLPIGESDLVADWLLDQAGLDVGKGLMGWWYDAGGSNAPNLHPSVHEVVVACERDDNVTVALTTPADIEHRIKTGDWPSYLRWSRVDAGVVRQAEARIALIRALQIVGAMESSGELAISYATEREQFGRPIARFQAVQGQLARMAAEIALVRSAADSAVIETIAHGDHWDLALPAIAVARSCAGHGAAVVSRSAHQVVGAIGTTKEHRLHRYTTAMLAWRSEFGDTRSWDRRVLDMTVARERMSDLDFNTSNLNIHHQQEERHD